MCFYYKIKFLLYYIFMSLQEISNSIDVIKDFPEKGTFFRNIEGLLANPDLYNSATNMMVDLVKNERIDYVMGFESRGFIFGQTIASKLGKGFCMLKKPNVGSDSILTVQTGLIPPESYVLLVDDLLSSGGSFLSGCELMKNINCHVSACLCLIELIGLQRKKELSQYKILSLIKYPANREDKFISKEEELLFKIPVEYTKDHFDMHDNRIVVLAHPSMKEISDNITKFSKYFVQAGMKWSHSSDNYPLITFENLKYLINKRIVFFGSLYNRANFSEQLSLLTRLPNYTIKSLDIIIPYFAPGLHRLNCDSDDSLSTAKSYAKIISKCLVTTQDGPPRIHIYDINSTNVESWFTESVVVNVDTAIPLIKNKIDRNTTIVFPTQKIQDKYIAYFKNFRIYNVDTKKTINWPQIGYDTECMLNVLIIDDWIQTGSVIQKCYDELIKLGAKNISAYATHAVFPNGTHINSIFDKFDKIYVTNSIPEITAKIKNKHPFEILHLDNLIIDKLLNLFNIHPVNLMVPIQYNVFVSSENFVKLKATFNAVDSVLKLCEKDEYNLKVFGVETPSGIDEQPVNHETFIGCNNRLENLIKYINTKNLDCDFIVSIESGVYWDGDLTENTKVKEHCQVIVAVKSNNHIAKSATVSSLYTTFPAKFMIDSINCGKQITVGTLIENAYGYYNETWNEYFDNKISKHDIIFNTIVETFSNVNSQLLI